MTENQIIKSNKIRVIYMGTPHFAVAPLAALIADPKYQIVAVITQPSSPAGRGKKIIHPPVYEIAVSNKIKVFQPKSIKKAWKSIILPQLEAVDCSVVCAYGQILSNEILEYPKFGSINIHASILPKWRGAAPIHRSIMAGDSTTGITLMKMDSGLDTGDCYISEQTPIYGSTTTGELHDTLSKIGAKLITEHLKSICEGTISCYPQDNSIATYANKIEKQEALINWDQPADQVSCHIRGLSPFPGAYSYYEGKRIKILNAYSVSYDFGHVPSNPLVAGKIYRADSTRLEVCCKDGLIAVIELQLEGRAKLKVDEFLKGFKISVGDFFTSSSNK